MTIIGKCKSRKCNNTFLGVVDEKPLNGIDVLIKVKSKDTRGQPHDKMKRQLRNKKRQIIGPQVAQEGAANFRRKLAVKVQRLGDVEAPNLYKSDVLRKLAQETKTLVLIGRMEIMPSLFCKN